jgi:transposase InsO family protein
MPWRQAEVSEERRKFVTTYLKGAWSLSELCESFGISRKTGYKYLDRFMEQGPPGLDDRSRAPHHHKNATPPEVVEAIVDARRAHPTWGPRKLCAWLAKRHSDLELPAASTAGDILKRHGLITPRMRRRRSTPSSTPLTAATHANALWCADYKGWFMTGDGHRCDPLTITDGYSRYLLACHVVPRPTFPHTQRRFEWAFREYGLPEAIRTDNGAPFASTALGGLSRLSVWWIKLGIRLERIEPGKPQQNGRHERMHGTLKLETTRPPRPTARAQQRSFDAFRHEFNCERPHEALGNRTPKELYQDSRRTYPAKLSPVEYPSHLEVRRVRTDGTIKWRSHFVYVSEVLVGEPVALERTGDTHLKLYFSSVVLGVLDEIARRILPSRRLTRATQDVLRAAQ